jgi:hypothetical protein
MALWVFATGSCLIRSNTTFQDIENVDDDELVAGAPQYSDDDVIVPSSENDAISTSVGAADANNDDDASNRPIVLDCRDNTSPTESIVDANLSTSPEVNAETLAGSDLKALVTKLMKENEELKRQVVCKICMDPVYNKPLVILILKTSTGIIYIKQNL